MEIVRGLKPLQLNEIAEDFVCSKAKQTCEILQLISPDRFTNKNQMLSLAQCHGQMYQHDRLRCICMKIQRLLRFWCMSICVFSMCPEWNSDLISSTQIELDLCGGKLIGFRICRQRQLWQINLHIHHFSGLIALPGFLKTFFFPKDN